MKRYVSYVGLIIYSCQNKKAVNNELSTSDRGPIVYVFYYDCKVNIPVLTDGHN